ncbi:hypothetical protein ACFL6S_28010 [Candidatus Poribacteria bacterium]
MESQPTRLRCEGGNKSPVWSPDGKSLAYMSNRYSSKTARQMTLVIRSIETGEERELRAAKYSRLRWSPDGRSILCSIHLSTHVNKPHRHRLIDVQTGNVTPILESHRGMTVSYPEWSRDGKTLFYIGRHPDKDWDFFSIVAHDLATGQERELYTDGYDWCSMIVSPDGQKLAFSDENQKVLKVISTAGGELHILRIENWVAPVTWTLDGRHVIYIRGISLPGGKHHHRFGLFRIPTEGGEPEKLWRIDEQPQLRRKLRDASFHPDGHRIAFAKADDESQREIWVMENLLTTFAGDK